MYDTLEEIEQGYKNGNLAKWEYEVMKKLKKQEMSWSEAAKVVDEYIKIKKEIDRS